MTSYAATKKRDRKYTYCLFDREFAAACADAVRIVALLQAYREVRID